jgi:hypothetical protein
MRRFKNNTKKVFRAVSVRLNKLISKYDENTVLWAIRKFDKGYKAIRSRELKIVKLEQELTSLKKVK